MSPKVVLSDFAIHTICIQHWTGAERQQQPRLHSVAPTILQPGAAPTHIIMSQHRPLGRSSGASLRDEWAGELKQAMHYRALPTQPLGGYQLCIHGDALTVQLRTTQCTTSCFCISSVMASSPTASPLARKLSHCTGKRRGGAFSVRGVCTSRGIGVLVKWLPHLVDSVQRVPEVSIPQHHSIEVGQLGPRLHWGGADTVIIWDSPSLPPSLALSLSPMCMCVCALTS